MKKQKPARKPLLPWGLLSVVLMLVFATTPAYGSDFATPTLHVMQQAALDGHTRSITFLASGYLSSEQDLFLKNVQTCIDALHNNSGGVVTDPWPRYAALFNMYAVFQPSSEQGAGRERLFAHNCLYMNSCGYRPSEGNNLLCAFGSPNPNIISCNLPLVLSLASFAPAEDVAVVLVNDNEASGIGTDGIAYITNYEPFMVYMLVHYLNRAIAGLQEEYSLGFSQLSDMADYGGPNCAYDPSVAESKWSIWYAFTDNADPMDGPGFGCTFSNYNSPTTNDCLMRNSSINVMCPVCREQLVRSFYDDGVPLNHLYSPTKTPINLGAGRCPPEGVTTYVTAGLTLSVGAFADQNDVTVQWTLADGTSLGTGRTLRVADTTGWTLPTTVRAVVVDSTAYVRPNWRTPLNSESIFLVASKGTATCDNPLPTCFGELTPPVTTACTACATAEDCTSKFTPQKVVLNPDDVPTAELPHDGAVGIVVATLSSTIAVAVLVIIFISHRRHIMKRPREVLDVRTFDRFIYLCLCVLSVVLLCAAVILLSYVLNSTSSRFVSGIHIILISCIFGGVTYVASIFNLVTVLKRWYVPCLVCAGIIFLDGVGFFIIGAFALWAHMNRESKQLSDALARLWHTTVSTSSGNDFICVVQKNLHCSGYHTGCFMTNSSECPTNCISNLYVNACEVPFIEVVSDLYLPVGIVCIICGFIFVLTAMLDVMYYLRYRQLSRTGKLRRSFRNDPRAPVIPITYTEASMVRISFQDVCRKPEETLEGAHAVNFLTTVFGEPLTDEYAELVAGRGPMTFDQLMCLHFPYIQAGAMDPRMLTPDEADDSSDMIELQKKQLAKLESFMVASGCLSPEQLNNIFQTYTKSRFLPDSEELLKEIRLAANDCEYEPFCKGLSPVELEGLRGAWVSLHSALSGYLSDEEIDIFYQWSHNEVVKGGTGFDKWKSSLDVSKNGGKIGWGEFCYPYAQRSLLRHARAYLAAQKKDVPPELVSRSSVEEKYTADTAEKCFMKYEQEIPIERLVAFLLRESSTKKKKAEEESNPAIQ